MDRNSSNNLCPLHISRSDAPIGLQCSRRQFGTKPIRRRVGTPFTLAEWRAMRTFASVGTRESYNIVRLPGWYGERVIFITTLSCVVHVRLPIGRRRRAILNMFNMARRPPDEAPTADSGSGTHSHWPSRQHRSTIGASDRLMWSGH